MANYGQHENCYPPGHQRGGPCGPNCPYMPRSAVSTGGGTKRPTRAEAIQTARGAMSAMCPDNPYGAHVPLSGSKVIRDGAHVAWCAHCKTEIEFRDGDWRGRGQPRKNEAEDGGLAGRQPPSSASSPPP